MRNLFRSFLDLIFPPRCEICKKPGEAALCPECSGQIKFMKPHLGIYSVSNYEGIIRSAIHRFKFKNRKDLAEALGIIAVKYISHTPSLCMEEIDIIVPVPLHRNRLRSRGFNQVSMIAKAVERYYGVPVIEALSRVRDTRAQFDLERGARFKNVYRAFHVPSPERVKDMRVLLMDDIYTTGATIMECSKALKAAGARRVEILTLSRAADI